MKRSLLFFALSMLLIAARPALAAEGDTFNIRFSPVPLLIGALGLELDVKVHDSWTIGPVLGLARVTVDEKEDLVEDIEIRGGSLGVRGTWFYNGVYTDGFYVAPSVGAFKLEAESADALGPVEGEVSGGFVQAVAGYGWYWESFNILLGAGLHVPMSKDEIVIKDALGNETKEDLPNGTFAGEFTLGWTF